MSNPYLEHYEQTLGATSYRGPAGWVRLVLDRKARAMGQPDRHALFLHRVLALASLPDSTRDISVLDIGCGNGWALTYVSPPLRYFAVDQGDRYRAALEARGVAFSTVDVTKEPLPYSDAVFDLIVLNHVIEHIADYDAFADELSRVLADTGHVYIRTPNINRVRGRFYDDYSHVKPYTPRSLADLMRAHGFEKLWLFYSDHRRINLDILSGGLARGLLMGRLLGGKEIEALFVKR